MSGRVGRVCSRRRILRLGRIRYIGEKEEVKHTVRRIAAAIGVVEV